MRITLTTLASAALFTAIGFGQGQDKTFYFKHPASESDMTAVATMVRTMLELQDISVDREHRALVVHGPVDRLVALEWLFDQLDRPVAGAAQYKMSGDRGEVIAVIPIASTATNADLTAATTAIRTIVDLQRLFPYAAQMVIVGRGEPDRIAAAEWIASQLSPRAGQAPTGDSPPYPVGPLRPDKADTDSLIRVFRMDPKTTGAELTAMVTAIRTIADIQRLFPFQANTMIMRASPSQVAVAGWLVHEMAKPADATAVHQTTMPGLIDGVVRLFYVGRQADVAPLVTRIRSTLDIQRLYPFANPSAVVLRGRPDQMSSVEAMVAEFASEAH